MKRLTWVSCSDEITLWNYSLSGWGRWWWILFISLQSEKYGSSPILKDIFDTYFSCFGAMSDSSYDESKLLIAQSKEWFLWMRTVYVTVAGKYVGGRVGWYEREYTMTQVCRPIREVTREVKARGEDAGAEVNSHLKDHEVLTRTVELAGGMLVLSCHGWWIGGQGGSRSGRGETDAEQHNLQRATLHRSITVQNPSHRSITSRREHARLPRYIPDKGLPFRNRFCHTFRATCSDTTGL